MNQDKVKREEEERDERNDDRGDEEREDGINRGAKAESDVHGKG